MLLPLKRRHWITIREIDGIYYNLDSKIEGPQQIGEVRIFFFIICMNINGKNLQLLQFLIALMRVSILS